MRTGDHSSVGGALVIIAQWAEHWQLKPKTPSLAPSDCHCYLSTMGIKAYFLPFVGDIIM